MDIVARSIQLVGNMPELGERAGGPRYQVKFEVRDPDNSFEIKFDVTTKDGLDAALKLARANLAEFGEAIKAEALNGDLGHGTIRLF